MLFTVCQPLGIFECKVNHQSKENVWKEGQTCISNVNFNKKADY